jgi:RNA polymerase sigma-70 factor, ECF subfamily
MTVTTTDDRATFTRLFDEHRAGVHASLLGRTSDAEAAKDLLQETFLRVWRRVDEVAALPPERQRAWIHAVGRNLVIDRYRAEATRRATLAAVRGRTPEAVDDPDTVERLAVHDELDQVQRAITDLPEELRTILTMSAVGELTSRQIGEALELPPGTVRAKLHQARTRLTDRLEVSR